MTDELLLNLRLLGTIATIIAVLIAVLIAVWTLKANHNWNRRRYTLGLLEDWNIQTAKHRKTIERLMPGLIDINNTTSQVVELSVQRATDIYLCTPDNEVNKGDWELRFSLIELFNYFEIISTAWYANIGDRDMIDDSFKDALLKYHGALKCYIEVVNKNVDYRPWKPYADLVAHWQQSKSKGWRKTA